MLERLHLTLLVINHGLHLGQRPTLLSFFHLDHLF